MYNINDEITIINGNILIKAIITKINLDRTFIVKVATGEELRIYREDIID